MIALKQSTLFTLPDGIYPDGANLYFRVRSQGKYREFLYRCTIRGKATYKSLGTAKKLTLKEARQKAKTFVPEESYPKILFKDAYLKALPHVANFKHWKNEEHATKRFEESIRIYWLPHLGSYYVSQLTVEDVVKACKINWEVKPASCERALGNLRSLFTGCHRPKCNGVLQAIHPIRVRFRMCTINSQEFIKRFWRVTRGKAAQKRIHISLNIE